MIPADIRLYTWVDVEEVLLRSQKNGGWPGWLVWARAYWDGLTLGITPGKNNEALEWLAEKFEPRFEAAADKHSYILLESGPDRPRRLDVVLEETEETLPHPRFTPSLRKPTTIVPPYEIDHPEPFAPDLPPVVVLHSFKGGVGRTLHSLALAQALVEEGHTKSRVLLIDGDLEAPGLTWLLRDRFPNLTISFVDFLALVHGDPDPEATSSLELIANQVKHILLDGVYVFPAFRSLNQFTSLEVEPEHLIQGAKDPFVLTMMLARLGKLLNVRAVIVDLRAGFSELSAGLLLDPRVYRILVTTLSAQSIEGTCQVLRLLAELAPAKEKEEPLPALIISQVPDDFKRDSLEPVEKQLLTAAEPFLEDESEDIIADYPLLNSHFDQSLVVLPNNWDKVMTLLRDLIEQLNPLLDWLPGAAIAESDQETARIDPTTLNERREKLAQFANELIFAETGNVGEFLVIPPLRRLAADFSAKSPITISIGAKGAGKTYTFIQVVRRGTWQTFIRDVGTPEISIDAYIYPILKSKNFKETANEIIQNTERKTAEAIGLSSLSESQRISDYIRDNLKADLHEGQWRERWLNIIAWRMGFETESEDAGRKFAEYLRNRKQFVVGVIDGLEDLFQNLSSEKSEQTALRSLLQDVPEWLEQQPGRPMGLLIFARQDMVLNAVRQNAAQLIARHEPYALKWNTEEALRLVAWICLQAQVLLKPSSTTEDLQEMGKAELVDVLEPLWGRKLGSERSREARSTEWIIAALSDLNGQIQARDLVRFLHKAAQDSTKDTYWTDRLLAPTAIRNAVGTCSEEKIKEIQTENSRLGNILLGLRDLPDDDRWIPFTREQLQLGLEELKILEDNGVILREGEEYYMPEIFRLGLDFKLRSGVRPRVLTLSRRTRRARNFGTL